MTLSEFDEGKRANFMVAIATTAGVLNADVIIDKVETIDNARRGQNTLAATRRLLATGIRIDIRIKAADENAAEAMGARLTITAINEKLQQAGLPPAAILGNSGSDTHACLNVHKWNYINTYMCMNVCTYIKINICIYVYI